MTLTAENLPKELRMTDFNIILIDLDTMVGETICKNADDSYTVFLNARWSSEMQRKCFEHALSHVLHNDWEKSDANQIEGERHEKGDSN